jgi:type IV pilus assembly protein PilZ
MVDQAQPSAEAREHARAPIELKVDYRKLNAFFADYTKNISKGGTFIKTKKPLPVGTRFHFHLTVPRRPVPFELVGEVVWATSEGEGAGMGIKFVYAEEAQRAAFARVVEDLMVEQLGSELARRLLARERP